MHRGSKIYVQSFGEEILWKMEIWHTGYDVGIKYDRPDGNVM